MTPTHSELQDHFREIDANLAKSNPGDAIFVDRKEAAKTLQNQIENQDHPFGYNDNNRAVAERVARDERRLNRNPIKLATPLTPGEASEADLSKADEFEENDPTSLDKNFVTDEHADLIQRQDILATRAKQVASLKDSRRDDQQIVGSANQPVQPPSNGMEGRSDAPAPSKPAPPKAKAPIPSGTPVSQASDVSGQGSETQAPPTGFAPLVTS